MKYKVLLTLLLAIVLYQACNNGKRKRGTVARDTTVNKVTSFNTLFFDSSQLTAFIDSNLQYEAYSDQFDDFYSHRNFEFAWFDTSGLAEQAHNFMNLSNNYMAEFNDSSFYNPKLQQLYDSLAYKNFHPRKDDPILVQAELMITGQFFQYAAKVYKGSDINAQELGWFIPRKKIDLTALLDSTISNKGKDTGIDGITSVQYQNLETAFAKYSALDKNAVWDSLPNVKKSIKLGDSALIISQIKQKLITLGDMQNQDTSGVYDSSLATGIRSFQKRMGLATDGVIGNKVIEELNVPIKKRLRQMLINLERMRWMPIERDSNFILVNIPEYKMHVYDSGRQLFDMNVIVGKQGSSTVIFSNRLQYIVFSPYWNVPESIVRNEIVPALNRNRSYLAKNNMEITGTSRGLPIVRQKPGPQNSLGLVKFLFPNNYNIYFHDTPNRELFNQSTRGFSHGCIRIGDPKGMAMYLLRSDSSWNEEKINAAMHLSKEKWVSLKKSVPVYITYFTAWVDGDGMVNFRKDIYGHDAKMGDKLFSN